MYRVWETRKTDDNGSYIIRIKFNNAEGEFYIDDVYHAPPKKRKAISLREKAERKYGYRSKSNTEKNDAMRQELLDIVPEQFLLEALAEAWKQTKPIGLVVGFKRQ